MAPAATDASEYQLRWTPTGLLCTDVVSESPPPGENSSDWHRMPRSTSGALSFLGQGLAKAWSVYGRMTALNDGHVARLAQ